MFRTMLRTRLFEDGSVEIIDPDIESLPLLRAINPEFKIKHAGLENFTNPRFQYTRKIYLPIETDNLSSISIERLWDVHDSAIKSLPKGKRYKKTEVSLLDVKIELAKRYLKECKLCGRKCGVDRLSGQRGICGVGVHALAAEYFIHISEEAPVNPSLNINLRGCGLRCRFCQQHEILDPGGPGVLITSDLWKQLTLTGARSISFVGGNPDESLYAILGFISYAPKKLKKPVVWNSNGYASKIVYKLLSGIVDAYIPDMKFYSKICSKSLSGCENYFEMFQEGIAEMVKQDVPIFVRMLIMPGHKKCCHEPLIEFLAKYNHQLKLNILGQYYPDYMISEKDFPMNSRSKQSEIEHLIYYAATVGGSEWLISSQ